MNRIPCRLRGVVGLPDKALGGFVSCIRLLVLLIRFVEGGRCQELLRRNEYCIDVRVGKEHCKFADIDFDALITLDHTSGCVDYQLKLALSKFE